MRPHQLQEGNLTVLTSAIITTAPPMPLDYYLPSFQQSSDRRRHAQSRTRQMGSSDVKSAFLGCLIGSQYAKPLKTKLLVGCHGHVAHLGAKEGADPRHCRPNPDRFCDCRAL